MKYFYKFLTILLGIVVSALAFHGGGPGSISWLGKSSNQFLSCLKIYDFKMDVFSKFFGDFMSHIIK